MPRGITQDQVNAAADTLVAAGDKPTVEKVRAALGTGSPNTVTRMLDTWRGGLAERLQNVLQLPDLPPEAGQAMTALWQLAVAHAERLLQARLAEDRAALSASEARLQEERAHWTATLAEAETTVAQARTRQELAEHACANLDSQLCDSHVLREDLVQQRDRLQAVVDRQTSELEALQAEKTARLAATDQERERTAVHIRATEDRAHQEVDRARQETKQWQQRHEATERSYREAVQALEARCEASHRQLQTAEKEVARLSGKAAALETSLAKASARPRAKHTPRSVGSSKAAKAKKSTK
ncbi:DNA-binding protein [Rhodanobacter sp. UC4437_H4]